MMIKVKMLKDKIEYNELPENSNSNNRKVALIAINARYSHTNLAVRLIRQACLAQDQQSELLLAEYTINDRPLTLLQKLNELDCKVYAFSCYIWNRELVTQLVRELKQIRPGCIIIAGGPEISWQPQLFLEQNKAVDLVISGAGENVLPGLLNNIIDGMDIREACSGFNNIVFRYKQEIKSGINGENYKPDPDWPFAYTTRELNTLADRILYYESSRGCPFGCTYCLSALEKHVVFRPVDLVCQELERFISAEVRLVKFVDRTFNCNAIRARQIWKWLIVRFRQTQFRTRFHFEITAELLEDECIELLSHAPEGLFQFEIGVQSTQQEVLTIINRKCRLDLLTKRVSQLVSARNIHIHLDLIAGLPAESFAMFRTSFDTVADMRPDMLQLGFLKILPGSLMQLQASERKMAWQARPPYEILYSDAMTFDELSVLKRIENMVDMFYNSGQFRFCMNRLLKSESSPFALYLEMAELYVANGWETRQIGRQDKWEFLIEFCAKKRVDSDQNQLRDLLVLDFISSGQKDRPDWQRSFEYSAESGDRILIKQVKDMIREHFPDCRRYRIEKFSINPSSVYENCLLQSADDHDSAMPSNRDKDAAVGWLAVFDFGKSIPVLIWQQKLYMDLFSDRDQAPIVKA